MIKATIEYFGGDTTEIELQSSGEIVNITNFARDHEFFPIPGTNKLISTRMIKSIEWIEND